MNDSTNQDIARLKQMLEEVTAADAVIAPDAGGTEGDAESASLREAWLAFGQVIRAADASLPAMDLRFRRSRSCFRRSRSG